MKKKIEQMLLYVPMSERIAMLESLCKQYRRTNSIRINEKQMGRRIDSDRPDLQMLKAK
jgi:hypothetical protein